MPPINDFSVGRDLTLSVVTGNGPIQFSLITAFRSKADTQEQKIKGMDGVTRHVRFWDGWSGSFSIERQDATVDDYFAQLEADYYAGNQESPNTITETITERDGSVSQFRYIGVLLKLDDAGEWKGDATVKQSLSFIATQRIRIV